MSKSVMRPAYLPARTGKREARLIWKIDDMI